MIFITLPTVLDFFNFYLSLKGCSIITEPDHTLLYCPCKIGQKREFHKYVNYFAMNTFKMVPTNNAAVNILYIYLSPLLKKILILNSEIALNYMYTFS